MPSIAGLHGLLIPLHQVIALCPVTCNDCPEPASLPDDDVWRPDPVPCSSQSNGGFGLCGVWSESFDTTELSTDQLVRFELGGTARLFGGELELTPARANNVARDTGVLLLDPGFDDALKSLTLSLDWSAYGGSGADGLSIHFAHRSLTNHWITVPDYRAFERLHVATGLSVLADELSGTLIVMIDGVELGRETYGGGRKLPLSLDWTPARLLLRVAGLSFNLPGNGSHVLRPAADWILSAAARTGTMNNIHSVDNVNISRCYFDFAGMRAAALAGDGRCLPNVAYVKDTSGGSLYEANNTASYFVTKPFCEASVCAPPVLTTGQAAISGCETNGVLGVSSCALGCAAGYTASEASPGVCRGVPGSTAAAYLGQAVSCSPNPCRAPEATKWAQTSLNGLVYFVNVDTGGQSFTRPVDGTIPGVSLDGGCAEGAWINFSRTCSPRCTTHYGPSETELTCDGSRLVSSGIATYTPPPPPPPVVVTLGELVHVGRVLSDSIDAAALGNSARPILHSLLGSLSPLLPLRVPAPPPPRYLPTAPPLASNQGPSLAVMVQLPAPCDALDCAFLQPLGAWHSCGGDTPRCVPRGLCDDCAHFFGSANGGESFARISVDASVEIAAKTLRKTLVRTQPTGVGGNTEKTRFAYLRNVRSGPFHLYADELVLSESATSQGVLENPDPSGSSCSALAGACGLLTPVGTFRLCDGGCVKMPVGAIEVAAQINDVTLVTQSQTALDTPATNGDGTADGALVGSYALGGESLLLSTGKLLLPLSGVSADAPGGCSQPQQAGGRQRWLCSSVFILTSTDDAASWAYAGRVEWTRDGAAAVSGPQSIAMAELADGRVLGLVSVGPNCTIYRTVSADAGASWSTLEPTNIWSVEPQLLVLPNGAIVVTAARPGFGLWTSVDGAGATFERHDLADHAGFSQAMVGATGPGSIVAVPETSGQTSLQLLDCYSSVYWGGSKCEVSVLHDALRADGSASVYATKVTVHVDEPPTPQEFSCVYCYRDCVAVLEECPTCSSGEYPICALSAVNYVYCNMESSCEYDFQREMDELDMLAAEAIVERATGADPIFLPLKRSNFAYDGAVFADGRITLSRGGHLQTTAIFDRPLRVDIVARQSSSANELPGCLNFYVFPEVAAERYSPGYIFGGGWWGSCLGSGNVRGGAGRVCATETSAAVQSTMVQLRLPGLDGCLMPAANGLSALILGSLCNASVPQLWLYDEESTAFQSQAQPGQCLSNEPNDGAGKLQLRACASSDARQHFPPQLDAHCNAGRASNAGGWLCVRSQRGPTPRVTTSSELHGCAGGGLGCAVQAFDGRRDDGGAAAGLTAIDNVNFWHSMPGLPLPQWIGYDFGAPTPLCAYSIVARQASCCHTSDSPQAWQLRGFDPASPSASGGARVVDGWAVLDEVRGEMNWGAGESRYIRSTRYSRHVPMV